MSGYWGSSYSKDFQERGLLKDENGDLILDDENRPQPIIIRNEMKLGDQLSNRERKSFGFNLRIPIFNGGIVNRNIANAKINIDRSKLNMENRKNDLRKEIQQAHANAKAAMNKYFSSETAVSSTEEAFRYTEEKFNLGLVNSVDYNQEKTTCFKPNQTCFKQNTNTFSEQRFLTFTMALR